MSAHSISVPVSVVLPVPSVWAVGTLTRMGQYGSPADWQWRVDRAAGWLREGGSVLFLGTASRDQSTGMLTAIAARTGAYRTLRGAADPAHPQAPYSALADLLVTVTDGDLLPLPEPQRAILTGAPFRQAPRADYFTPAAVRLAVLNLLRRFARTGPVLLVIDQLHHLDPASADVLRFVARAGAGLPIHVLATEQLSSTARSAGYRMCPRPLLVLGLGSLTPADVRILIDALTVPAPPDARS